MTQKEIHDAIRLIEDDMNKAFEDVKDLSVEELKEHNDRVMKEQLARWQCEYIEFEIIIDDE